jgi:hypothetical protein
MFFDTSHVPKCMVDAGEEKSIYTDTAFSAYYVSEGLQMI